MKQVSLLLLALIVSVLSSFAQEEFIPEEILNDNQYEFTLYHLGDRFELHSCIDDELYQDHLVRPSVNGGRTIHRNSASGEAPLVVKGGTWENGCLIVHYSDSELPESDWLDLLVTITKLSPEQIKIIHQ